MPTSRSGPIITYHASEPRESFSRESDRATAIIEVSGTDYGGSVSFPSGIASSGSTSRLSGRSVARAARTQDSVQPSLTSTAWDRRQATVPPTEITEHLKAAKMVLESGDMIKAVETYRNALRSCEPRVVATSSNEQAIARCQPSRHIRKAHKRYLRSQESLLDAFQNLLHGHCDGGHEQDRVEWTNELDNVIATVAIARVPSSSQEGAAQNALDVLHTQCKAMDAFKVKLRRNHDL